MSLFESTVNNANTNTAGLLRRQLPFMSFNFKGLFHFSIHWLKSGHWSGRRLLIVIAFFVFFPLLQAIIWFGLLLDNLLFRRFRTQAVNQPVFITGMYRSGTTFLHRLLAMDPQYSTMAMWEILFAPSIAQRRLVSLFSRLLKTPVNYLLHRTEARWQEQNVMHKVSLREPEEDDYLLLHIWSLLTTGLSSGLLDEALPYTYFDQRLAAKERKRIFTFYRGCVQRHLSAHRVPASGHYLAKNPALCPKLQTVYETFPDAKIIYLVRNPLEVIPSFLSMMVFTWRVIGVSTEVSQLREFLLQMARHWYEYPLQILEQMPADAYVIVKYDDLVNDPSASVKEIYTKLGLTLSSDFAAVLQRETEAARDYRSRHDYSLEKLGLDHAQILQEFEDIFLRFGFDRGETGQVGPINISD